MRPHRRARIISIGGGKGGVGKSVVAANLAVAMAQEGVRVSLVDADLGAANQHTLFGIERPGPTVHALFTHEIESIVEAAVQTEQPRLTLIRGSGAVLGAANIHHAQKLKLIRQIAALDDDVVIVDVGAGVSFNVLDLFDVADLRLVVTTPQLTAVQNAYCFLKGAVLRTLGSYLDEDQLTRLTGRDRARETDRLPDRLTRLRRTHAELADRAFTSLDLFGARILGNQVTDPGEVGVFHAFSRMVGDFLGTAAPVLGALTASARVHDSVNRRRPFLLDYRHDENARTLRRMAALLLGEDLSRISEERRRPAGAATSRQALPEEAVPPLDAFGRSHERHSVDWRGTLYGTGTLPVRVCEVSLGGALLEAGPLAPGEHWTLSLPGLDGAPRLPLVIRNLRPDGQAGAEFLVAGEVPERLVEAALSRRCTGSAA